MNNKIIFYHPLPLTDKGASGSRVRPNRMITAFQSLGYDVTSVTGFYHARKQIIARKILDEDYLFCYAESSNLPLAFANKHRLPYVHSYDHKLFRYLKEKSIPSGIFLRDLYWCFDYYKKSVKYYRRFYNKFWLHELQQYRNYFNILFLPTLKMSNFIPIRWNEKNILALPPGCEPKNFIEKKITKMNDLKLLYIGNITPPLYDIRRLTEVVSKNVDVSLDIICRKTDWKNNRHIYKNLISDGIEVFHKSGNELISHYASADIFITYRDHHPYLDITLPVKIHEAWSFGLPVIVKQGGIDARWVEKLQGGWIVNDSNELHNLLNTLKKHKFLIENKKNKIKKIIDEHSWRQRAEYVANLLTQDASPNEFFF